MGASLKSQIIYTFTLTHFNVNIVTIFPHVAITNVLTLLVMLIRPYFESFVQLIGFGYEYGYLASILFTFSTSSIMHHLITQFTEKEWHVWCQGVAINNKIRCPYVANTAHMSLVVVLGCNARISIASMINVPRIFFRVMNMRIT